MNLAENGKEIQAIIDKETQAMIESLQPKALRVLLKAEKEFFDAIEMLHKKHYGLTTVEEINKLTKAIRKLCK
jgi:hypothetical protein